jgi:DNA-binding MarR family transcriptional regulator
MSMTTTAPAVDTAVALRRAVTHLGRRLRAERPPGALPVMQLTVLGHLLRTGPSLPSAIAAAEHHHPQSLTRVIATLAEDGLITRSASPDDGRATVLALTDAGREAIREDMRRRDAWLRRALAERSPAEVALLGVAAELLEALAAGPG